MKVDNIKIKTVHPCSPKGQLCAASDHETTPQETELKTREPWPGLKRGGMSHRLCDKEVTSCFAMSWPHLSCNGFRQRIPKNTTGWLRESPLEVVLSPHKLGAVAWLSRHEPHHLGVSSRCWSPESATAWPTPGVRPPGSVHKGSLWS